MNIKLKTTMQFVNMLHQSNVASINVLKNIILKDKDKKDVEKAKEGLTKFEEVLTYSLENLKHALNEIREKEETE